MDICIINRTSRIRDARFANVIPALQAQATEDFCPAWQIEAPTLHLVGINEQPDPSHWKMWFKDTTGENDALGLHDLQNGIPFAIIGVEDDINSGNEISVTAAHELHEMLVDPFINRMGPTIGDKQYIVETDDAVEADTFGSSRPGLDGKPVRLSNFVLPIYFIPDSQGPWDFAGYLKGPIPSQLPGGYLGWRSVSTGSWGTDMMRENDNVYSTRALRAFGRTWRRTKTDAATLVPHPLLASMGMLV
jgi:hypothetical protein